MELGIINSGISFTPKYPQEITPVISVFYGNLKDLAYTLHSAVVQ